MPISAIRRPSSTTILLALRIVDMFVKDGVMLRIRPGLYGSAAEQARAEAIKEAGDPEGVARILAFLASAEADYVRGTIYTR